MWWWVCPTDEVNNIGSLTVDLSFRFAQDFIFYCSGFSPFVLFCFVFCLFLLLVYIVMVIYCHGYIL